MYADPVRKILDKRKLLTGKSNARVAAVAKRMAARNVGAMLVLEGDLVVGIFTERDVVFRVVAKGLDPRTTRIADVMTPEPVTIEASRPFGYALALMHRHGFRHLPVMEHGKLLGIVSARNALDPDMDEFASETRRREHYHAMR